MPILNNKTHLQVKQINKLRINNRTPECPCTCTSSERGNLKRNHVFNQLSYIAYTHTHARTHTHTQVHAPGEYKGSPILRLSREVRSHYHSSKVSNRQLSRESRTLSSCSNSAQPLISPSFLTAQLHQVCILLMECLTHTAYERNKTNHL